MSVNEPEQRLDDLERRHERTRGLLIDALSAADGARVQSRFPSFLKSSQVPSRITTTIKPIISSA